MIDSSIILILISRAGVTIRTASLPPAHKQLLWSEWGVILRAFQGIYHHLIGRVHTACHEPNPYEIPDSGEKKGAVLQLNAELYDSTS